MIITFVWKCRYKENNQEKTLENIHNQISRHKSTIIKQCGIETKIYEKTSRTK